MVDKHPVNPFIQFIQFSLTAGVCGVGGFSIYAYLNGYGLIGDGGIIPLIGCGVSCFAVRPSSFPHSLISLSIPFQSIYLCKRTLHNYLPYDRHSGHS